MNQFDNLPSESEITPLAQMSYYEQEEANYLAREGQQEDNGQEDRYLDSSYEDRTEMDFGD